MKHEELLALIALSNAADNPLQMFATKKKNDPNAVFITALIEWFRTNQDELARAEGGEAVEVGAMDLSAPAKVWLQVDSNGDDEDRTEEIPQDCWDHLTWCYESIGGQEVVYIRQDLATNPSPTLARKAARYEWLRSHASEIWWLDAGGKHYSFDDLTYQSNAERDELDAAIDAAMGEHDGR